MFALTTAWKNDQNRKETFEKESVISNDFICNDEIDLSETYISIPTEPVIESTPAPIPAAYQDIANSITNEEIETLARLVYREAGNQSIDGQRAVVEVVFNRVMSDEFPNTIHEVIYQEGQFTPANLIPHTTPTDQQYEVVDEVLTNTDTILNYGVLFFSRGQYNEYLFDKIGDHYFCYSTKSYQNTMKGTT